MYHSCSLVNGNLIAGDETNNEVQPRLKYYGDFIQFYQATFKIGS